MFFAKNRIYVFSLRSPKATCEAGIHLCPEGQSVLPEKINKMNIKKLVISITACELAGVAGSIFTMPAIEGWYKTLQKPSFTPPNWLFGPVWIVLFLLMGIAAYLVWDKGWDKIEVRASLYAFCIQLALNVFWSILFFGLESPFFGIVEIFILWGFILLTMLEFYKISKAAGLLLFPYIWWVGYAAVINFFIWRLNL